MKTDTAEGNRDCIAKVDEDEPASEAGESRRERYLREFQFAEVCEKLATLGEREPDLPEAGRRELADLTKCNREIRVEYRERPAEYLRGAACVMAADTLDEFGSCFDEDET